MKNLILASLVLIASIGANAQTRPFQVYNGTANPITISAIVVGEVSSCSNATTISSNAVVAPFSFSPVYNAPFPGDPDKEWAAAKIFNSFGTILSVHPFFDPCLYSSVHIPSMPTSFWYPFGSPDPVQILKIY